MPDGRPADGRDRKVLRAAAIEMHRLATELSRRAPSARDVRQGSPSSRSAACRTLARLLEKASRGSTCADAKRAAIAACDGSPASRSATASLHTAVNMLATRAGVDPFEGEWSGIRPVEAGPAS